MTNKLRERAEAMLRTSATDVAGMSELEIQRLVYELQVHQIELEIQNEELRQAQVELARSRDRYSDLYEFAPIGYLTIDTAGVVMEANLTAAAMLDVERRLLTGCRFADFLTDDSQDTWHIHRREVFASESRKECEVKLQQGDHREVTMQLQSLVFQDGVYPNHCRTAIIDVSEQRFARDLLVDLNIDLSNSLSSQKDELQRQVRQVKLLSTVVSHLGEGVLITGPELDGPDSAIVFVNEAMCQISGYSAAELIGQSPRIMQCDQTNKETLSEIRSNLIAGQTVQQEVLNRRKDGSCYDAALFIMPLLDNDGQRTHFVSIHRDITSRKRSDEALRVSEDRLRLAFHATNDAIWDCDLVDGTIWWNEAYEEQFGRVHNADAWTWWEERIHPDDRDRVVSGLKAFAAGAGDSNRWTADYRLRYPDGSYAFVTDRALRSCDATGKPIRLLGAMVDQTQRRQLEQEVLDIAAAEHRRIGNDLHDGIGQELTGLSMIAGTLVTALERKALPETQLAEKLAAGVQRTLGQVRVLARGMNPVDVDAAGLMSAITEMCYRIRELNGTECEFQYDQPVLLPDNQVATQLYRIAQEAVTNAIKHGQANHISISVTQDDDATVLRVVDDGIGLPSDSKTRSGLGLRIMGYRAGIIGAQLQVQRHEPRGTEVLCTMSALV